MTKNRICKLCDSKTTYTQPNGKIKWYKYGNDYICNSCYRKEYYKNIYTFSPTRVTCVTWAFILVGKSCFNIINLGEVKT